MTKETRAKVGETTFKAYKEITKIAADAKRSGDALQDVVQTAAYIARRRLKRQPPSA